MKEGREQEGGMEVGRREGSRMKRREQEGGNGAGRREGSRKEGRK